MNRKQIISMWAGVGASVAFCILFLWEGAPSDYGPIKLIFFVIALITGALIITFKDKPKP